MGKELFVKRTVSLQNFSMLKPIYHCRLFTKKMMNLSKCHINVTLYNWDWCCCHLAKDRASVQCVALRLTVSFSYWADLWCRGATLPEISSFISFNAVIFHRHGYFGYFSPSRHVSPLILESPHISPYLLQITLKW